MIARDSTGRSVSLLNDEPDTQSSKDLSINNNNNSNNYSNYNNSSFPCHPFDYSQSHVFRSNTSSPATPSLTRADSCDASLSPKTPTSFHDFTCRNSYPSTSSQKDMPSRLNFDKPHFYDVPASYDSSKTKDLPFPKYEVWGACSEPLIQDADSLCSQSNPIERAPKRYPCRFRDSHHCQKTFTTSGHASRHSKIHTAEKGVSCSWPGCHKKFTRSDNMKQHLETHTKERLRGSKSGNTNAAVNVNMSPSIRPNAVKTLTTSNLSVLTEPAGIKKSPSGKRLVNRTVSPTLQADLRAKSIPITASTPMKSLLTPVNLKNLQLMMSTLPTHGTALSYRLNGLDTLALAAGTRY